MNDSGLPFILTVIIGLAIITMATLFGVYTSPGQKEGIAISVIEKSDAGYVLIWEGSIGPTPLLSPDRMRDVAAGGRHACTISMDDKMFCWGAGESGQLGNGGFRANSGLAVEVSGSGKWQSVASGENHSCGIAFDGLTLCWGAGESGQLGNGDYTSRPTPTPVDEDPSFIALSAGRDHSCGINVEGLAFCWGNGENGQNGEGGHDPQSRPSAVAGDLRFIDISAGYGHTCALSIDGTAWCWGKGTNGQIGNGALEDSEIPTSVFSNITFKAVAAGDGYSCALSNSGEAWCWGALNEGGKKTPFLVGKGPFQQISAGKSHACALRNGGIWCFRMAAEPKGLMADAPFGQATHITPVDRFQKISTREALALAIVK
ncbi:MAG TPA: hypothetical protein DCW68_07455 [Rhodospirillaceae bacterium]|nr:MAG: hypothetical protein A2018_06965 [Alphaproteobacteria bacterium GWF2_58_20]HAU29923.1 hypothetical protein [Rhodospirillaceae bacterium]